MKIQKFIKPSPTLGPQVQNAMSLFYGLEKMSF